MSIAGGLHLALERGQAVGCGAVQIFLKNRRLLNDSRFARISKVIETTKHPEPTADLTNLATLRRLRRRLS